MTSPNVRYVTLNGVTPTPTAEQVTAMRRIQIGLQRIHDANQGINKLIEDHGLDHLGIVWLSSHPQGVTMGCIAEVMRRHSEAFQSQKVAA